MAGLFGPDDTRPLTEVREGLAINLSRASLMVLVLLLLREGSKLHSPALVADGKHLLTDVYSSLGVIAGIALAAWLGIWWLDGHWRFWLRQYPVVGYHVVQLSQRFDG